MTDLLDKVASLLRRADRLLFVTGAGVSADSGLPTYRGIGGLYDGVTSDAGPPIEQILSGPMLRADPALCWTHIARIEQACRGAAPNFAHELIARLQDTKEVVVLTQNVDGLHRKAGSRQVIEIHGNVYRLRCTRCSWRDEVEDYAGLEVPPSCPACGRLIRPDVVLFEEWLPAPALADLAEAMATPFDLVFSIGTTSQFPYIAAPVLEQVRAGRPAVEINPGVSAISDQVPWRLRERAASALRELQARLDA